MKNNQTIGLIGAMDSEIAYLTGKLTNKHEVNSYGYTFYTGELAGKDVVIVKCGIGKVNAARGTQLLIDKFQPAAVINTGIAGAVAPELDILDVVIASGLVQHDFDVTPFGYPKGYLCTGVDKDKPTYFIPDTELVRALTKAAQHVNNEKHVTTGIIATGDVFVSSPETKEQIFNLFNAQCTEMEGAAITQVASYAGVPFAVLRVISDRADGQAAASFDQIEKESADKSAYIIEEFLKNI